MAHEPTDEAEEFADWLRAALEKAEISVRQAARRLAAREGTSLESARGSLYKWMRSEHTPSRQRRAVIGQVLGVPYPPSEDQTLAGRLATLEKSLLEIGKEGTKYRQRVNDHFEQLEQRLDRIEQRSGTGGHPSIARTAQ